MRGDPQIVLGYRLGHEIDVLVVQPQAITHIRLLGGRLVGRLEVRDGRSRIAVPQPQLGTRRERRHVIELDLDRLIEIRQRRYRLPAIPARDAALIEIVGLVGREFACPVKVRDRVLEITARRERGASSAIGGGIFRLIRRAFRRRKIGRRRGHGCRRQHRHCCRRRRRIRCRRRLQVEYRPAVVSEKQLVLLAGNINAMRKEKVGADQHVGIDPGLADAQSGIADLLIAQLEACKGAVQVLTMLSDARIAGTLTPGESTLTSPFGRAPKATKHAPVEHHANVDAIDRCHACRAATVGRPLCPSSNRAGMFRSPSRQD